MRPATVADAEAIERIRIRGWQVGYRHVFPPEELDMQPVDWSRFLRLAGAQCSSIGGEFRQVH